MPVVRINGKQLSYWVGGKGLSDREKTVLFIHGSGGSQLVWSYQKAFFEKGFDPIVIELSGHGSSDGTGEEEVGRYTEEIRGLLRALGLSRVFVVGHSMGGAIAQTLALADPGMLKGIALVGTGARLKVAPFILEGLLAHFEETVRRISTFAYSPKVSPELLERGISLLLRCRPEVLHRDFLACDRFDLISDVGRIDLPALIVCGAEDQLTPVKYSEFLHNHIQGSRLEILPGAGHMVMIEAPEAFNEKVGAFARDVL